MPQIFALIRIGVPGKSAVVYQTSPKARRINGALGPRQLESAVLDIDEIQARRRRSGTDEFPIPRHQPLAHPLCRSLAAAHLQQRPGNVAHHMLQECVCADVDDYQIRQTGARLSKRHTGTVIWPGTMRCGSW